MKQSIFNLFDAINREGITNNIWGFAKTSKTQPIISVRLNQFHYMGNSCTSIVKRMNHFLSSKNPSAASRLIH